MQTVRANTAVFTLLLIAIACSACGYRVRSSVGRLPSEARTLGIPTFKNLINEYKIEQLVTRAVINEFSQRTRAAVTSASSGVDLVLQGEIFGLSSTPVIFRGQTEQEAQTFASAFVVTVNMRVRLVRTSDSAVIWENNDYLYRERYVLNSSVRDFFSEENPALDRLAKNFAASLAGTVLVW